MPDFETTSFGRISYEPEWAIEFPSGLPGFEDRRRFAAVKFEKSAPLPFTNWSILQTKEVATIM